MRRTKFIHRFFHFSPPKKNRKTMRFYLTSRLFFTIRQLPQQLLNFPLAIEDLEKLTVYTLEQNLSHTFNTQFLIASIIVKSVTRRVCGMCVSVVLYGVVGGMLIKILLSVGKDACENQENSGSTTSVRFKPVNSPLFHIHSNTSPKLKANNLLRSLLK